MKKTIFLLMLALNIPNLYCQNNEEAHKAKSSIAIVDEQLDAYNARNIDDFVATYTEDIEIYNSQGELTMKGHKQLRERYKSLFENAPNLHCTIENRIIINNKVIDKERVIAGDRIIHAVAVYEVEDGKIKKVRFID